MRKKVSKSFAFFNKSTVFLNDYEVFWKSFTEKAFFVMVSLILMLNVKSFQEEYLKHTHP